MSSSDGTGGQPVLTPADGLGGPVPRVLAADFSVAVQDVVVDAAVPDLLLVAVRSHHSEGDEAVGDPGRDGAAHIWLSQSRGVGVGVQSLSAVKGGPALRA